jgi:hypothetical protein
VRWLRLARGGVTRAAVGTVTAACLASCSSAVSTGGESGSGPTGTAAAALATSIDTSDGTWATVAMGHLDQPDDTFWQLLHRAAGATDWTDQVQVTAVATNGGLVMASPEGRSLTVGVRPYDLLTFSPLVATADGGRSWSNGLLPGGLVSEPNALAVSTQGQALAITGKDGGRDSQSVLASPSLNNWTTLVTGDVVASSTAGQECAVGGLTAVAYAGTDPVVGARCNRAGVVGLFEDRGGVWTLAGPSLPPAMAQDQVAVTSVQTAGDGLSGLLSTSGPGGATVMVASTADRGRSWQLSQPLPVAVSERLASVGPTGNGGFFVLLSTPSGQERAAAMEADHTSWTQLPPLPAGTATLAFGPGTTVEALAVDASTLTVWNLGGTGSWQKGQVMAVSIEYGSSS